MAVEIDQMDANFHVTPSAPAPPATGTAGLAGLDSDALEALLAPLIRSLVRRELQDWADQYFRIRG